MSIGAWMAVAVLGASLLLALRRPLRKMGHLFGRMLARCGVGLAVLWGLQGIGPALGIHLGVNALNALVLGVLGAPGMGLLLLTQWVFRI